MFDPRSKLLQNLRPLRLVPPKQQEVVHRIRRLDERHPILANILREPVSRRMHGVQRILCTPRNNDRPRKPRTHTGGPLRLQRPRGDPRAPRREALGEPPDERASGIAALEDRVHGVRARVADHRGLRAGVRLRPVHRRGEQDDASWGGERWQARLREVPHEIECEAAPGGVSGHDDVARIEADVLDEVAVPRNGVHEGCGEGIRLAEWWGR